MTGTTQSSNPKGNPPTHTIYVNSYVNKQPIKVRVGVAWKHSKGGGFNISFDNMVAFENKQKSE